MSNPLVLVHFHDGEQAPVDTSVITGVLAPYKYNQEVLEVPDGGHVELSFSYADSEEHISSCHFALRINGFTPQVVECIYQMAKVGDMVLIPDQYTDVILIDSAQEDHMPEGVEWEPRLCHNAEELQEMLLHF